MYSHELLLAQTASKHLFGDDGRARGLDAATQIVVVKLKDIKIVFETDITSAPFEESRAASVSARGHVSNGGDVLVVADMYFHDRRFSGGDITLPIGPLDSKILEGDLQRLQILDVYEIE